jgi:taurine dioxygenase
MGKVDSHPELAIIRREPTDGRNTGGFWHTDQCFLPDPPLGSVLYAKQLPSLGGDTMFAHMGAACDALSDGLRDMLRGLRAVHVRLNYHGIDGRPQWGVTPEELAHFSEKYAGIEATHPVIGRHPESGQEILYLNPIYTDRFEGWTRAESQPLIQLLCARATRPENICRFHWEDGSLAMWDNRAVLHYALDDYPGETRVMQRCVVLGPWLQAPATA